jgi:hypothetical protein
MCCTQKSSFSEPAAEFLTLGDPFGCIVWSISYFRTFSRDNHNIDWSNRNFGRQINRQPLVLTHLHRKLITSMTCRPLSTQFDSL